jgi:hypothetical protein
LSQMPAKSTQKKRRREARLLSYRPMGLNGDLKSSDIIQIGVLHLCWYVATVYAIKLRNNIFLATRTVHSFIPFLSLDSPVSKSRLCARPFVKKNTGFPLDFSRLSGGKRMRVVESVESLDQKVGLEKIGK